HIFFGKANGGVNLVCCMDLLGDSFDRELLRDKIVIVGATAAALHDFHETSLGVMSGPEILAASLDTVISGRISPKMDSVLYRVFLVLSGLMVGIVLSTRTWWPSPVFSFSLFLAALAIFPVIFAKFLLFIPVSCFFLAWAHFSAFFNFIEGFNRTVEERVARAEAELAGEIQKSLFPESPVESESYSIRGFCRPCDATGGDFFDFFQLSDENLMFCLGDVSGHGFAAAMITVVAKTTIEMLRYQESIEPEKIIQNLNRLIFGLARKKKFMTMVIGYINIRTHTLELSFAGHLPPLIVNRNAEVVELKKTGFPMGVVKKLPVQNLTYHFQEGDSLVVYTDGIIEALNWSNEQYTFEAWYDYLKRKIRPDELIDDLNCLLEDVERHKEGRPFDDDVTLLLIQRKQRAASQEKIDL
ncbi:MAG: SpoIIE family protein phosphatase, partial [Candidatus Riflebacteria bacterium]